MINSGCDSSAFAVLPAEVIVAIIRFVPLPHSSDKVAQVVELNQIKCVSKYWYKAANSAFEPEWEFEAFKEHIRRAFHKSTKNMEIEAANFRQTMLSRHRGGIFFGFDYSDFCPEIVTESIDSLSHIVIIGLKHVRLAKEKPVQCVKDLFELFLREYQSSRKRCEAADNNGDDITSGIASLVMDLLKEVLGEILRHYIETPQDAVEFGKLFNHIYTVILVDCGNSLMPEIEALWGIFSNLGIPSVCIDKYLVSREAEK